MKMRTGKSLGLLAGVVVSVTAVAAEVGDSFLLQTKSTTMAFRRNKDNSWDMVHYGAKVSSEADVAALAWDQWSGDNHVGQRRPAAYSVFGDQTIGGEEGENKYGGLAVVHADGCLSTWLEGDKA